MLETHSPGEIKKSCPPRHPLGDDVHCPCLPKDGDRTGASRTRLDPGWGHVTWQQFPSLSTPPVYDGWNEWRVCVGGGREAGDTGT